MQRQSSLLGINAASLWASDLIVLTDYLATHPSLDPKRLAVAGCSGGGVQTAYLGAVDPRMRVVSVACYTSTLTVDYRPGSTSQEGNKSLAGGGGPAEGEQQFGPWVGAAPLLDKPDLVQIRAPQPTQILLTTRDQYFPLVGGLAAFNESLPAFKALAPAGQPPALSVCVGNNSHGYINRTRLCLYDFLSRNLLAKPDSGVEITDDKVQVLNFSSIRVTSTGAAITAAELNGGNGSITAHQAFVLPNARPLLAALAKQRKEGGGQRFAAAVAATAAQVVGVVPPASAAKATRLPDGASGTHVYTLPGEGRCKVALQLLPPLPHDGDSGSSSYKTVLYVSRKGGTMTRPKQGTLSAAETARLTAIRKLGLGVALVDPCGFGNVGDKAGDAFAEFTLPSRDYRTKLAHPVDVAFNLNRSVAGVHGGDVLRAAAAVATAGALPGAAASKVVATLSANETAVAVLAAALSAGGAALGDVALVESVASWATVVSSARYVDWSYFSFVFGGLRHFDIPDMVAALPAAQRALVLLPLDAMRKPQPANDTAAAFALAAKLKGGKGNASGGFEAVTDRSQLDSALLAWLA